MSGDPIMNYYKRNSNMQLNQPLNRSQLTVANAIRTQCIGCRRTSFTEAFTSRKITISKVDYNILPVFTQADLKIAQPDRYITWPIGMESNRPMVFRLKLTDNKEVIVSREGFNYCYCVAAFDVV